MNLHLEKISPSDWAGICTSVHKYSFSVDRKPEMDRIDFALLVRKDEELCAYATIIELDGESAYMQHGGGFKAAEGTTLTLRSYLMMVNWLKENYKTVSTKIWNHNQPMLRLAGKAGFLITGMQASPRGDLYLVHDVDAENDL